MPDPDLWHRIRVGFLLEPMDSPLVANHEDWYSSRPEYIKRFVDRGSLYLHHIVEQVEKRKMPMEIALLPVIESAFTPKAQSRAKASGLWQFIPSTGKNYGLTQTWWRDNRQSAPNAISEELERAIGLLTSHPAAGAPARAPRLRGVRRILLARVDYHVYYRIRPRLRRVEVIAFWHAHRSSPHLR